MQTEEKWRMFYYQQTIYRYLYLYRAKLACVYVLQSGIYKKNVHTSQLAYLILI